MMGSDPQGYLQAMHDAEHKACRERIEQLEGDLTALSGAHRNLNAMYDTERAARRLAERDLESMRRAEAQRSQSLYETLCPGLGYEPEEDGTWDIGEHSADTLVAEAGVTLLRLRNWVSDLQSGMRINCVYCGHDYGPKGSTPYTKAEVLRQHIAVCPEHPMSKLTRAATVALEAYRIGVGLGMLQSEGFKAAMRKLRRALPAAEDKGK